MAKRKFTDEKSIDAEQTDASKPWLHPRTNAVLIGHTACEYAFLSAFRAGTLHHAWLLSGEEGVGKATFAYRAARFLLSRGDKETGSPEGMEVPDAHPVARQLHAGAHPSLFVLGDASANASSIAIDDVRKLRSFLGLTSPAAWRAIVVDPANGLSAASANALLKAIEEPPPRTVFFLVAHGALSVIPAIRSRCVRLAFRPLGVKDFAVAIARACEAINLDVPDAVALGKLHELAAGSPGRALELLAGGALSLAETLDKILSGLPKLDYGHIHGLIQTISGARNAQNFSRLCDLIEERAGHLSKRALADGSGAEMSAAWAELCQKIRSRRLELESLNLDKGAFLMAAFSDMERTASRPLRRSF
jgi:DNA polymerase III subunit delta'